MASWRFSSTFTASMYSGLVSLAGASANASGFFATSRVSRSRGMEFLTEVRPVLATVICVPAALAKVASSQACAASAFPNLLNSVAASPFQSLSELLT
ncbi:hypothetical protein HRW07_12110 [Streptomyces lunaelactis]|uniref:hypothetical protein n=1 Tax=Streptomyces lunaelactis TaxID=1535768 RepID=UPI0015850D36|nr:hypothetical protein [Streptomyces lunaelactis]NUL03968.1 hypothetical protein [Streptomyces lunaelactis]